MQQIIIPVSFGELIDKICILEIKLNNISNEIKLFNIEHEYKLLLVIRDKIILTNEQLELLIILKLELYNINNRLWNIEDKIRIKEKNKVFDKEFLKLARSVYIFNDRRSDIKKQINVIFCSDIIEEKSF